VCPYEFAINELSKRWLNFFSGIKFFSSDENTPYENIDFYTLSGRRAVFTGTAIEIGKSLGNRIPVYKFNWSDQTTFLLDIILQKFVQAHIDELKFWLSSIEKGESPAYRVRFQPNIYLMLNCAQN
jgi:hypothetical protein